MLAPEAVLGGLADSVTRTGAEVLTGAAEDLSSAAQTISELDSIIADNPDAQNVDRLKALREQLKATPLSDTTQPQAQANAVKIPQARHAMDNPLIPRRAADQLTVMPAGARTVQKGSRAPTMDSSGNFRPSSDKSYTLDMTPVRLR